MVRRRENRLVEQPTRARRSIAGNAEDSGEGAGGGHFVSMNALASMPFDQFQHQMSTSHSALRPERLSQLHQGQGARVFVPDMDALFQRMGGLSLQRHRRGHPQAPSHSDVHPRAASRVVPRGSSTTNNPDHPRYDVPPSSVSLGSRRSRTAARPSTPQYSYEELLALDDDVVRRGISDRVMNQLPRTRISSQSTKTDCRICMEAFSPASTVIRLPCKHAFHEDCVKPWFGENRTCPVCRYEIEK